MLLGAWLRARSLEERPLSIDEHGTLWAVRGTDAAESIRRVEAVHGQSPLYYLLVRASLALTGESGARLRLVSVLAGALVPLAGFLALERAAGERAGAAALLLLALDPALVQTSSNARPYALAELGALVALAGLAHALRTGSIAGRLVTWSGALLAVYAHYVFAPVVPGLVLGALLARERAYSKRALALDVVVTLAALVPALRHMAALFARRDELAWVEHASLAPLGAVLPPRVRWIALAAVVCALLRRTLLRAQGQGVVLAALAEAGLAVAALVLLRALGSNIVDERYVALGVATMPLVVAFVLVQLPRALAALALLAVVLLGVPRLRPEGRLEPWAEARAILDARAPGNGDAIVFETPFIEASLVLRPGRAGPELRGFLASPLEDQPAAPPSGLRYVLVGRGDPGPFLEEGLRPSLSRFRRVFVVSTTQKRKDVEAWLASTGVRRVVAVDELLLSDGRTVFVTLVVT